MKIPPVYHSAFRDETPGLPELDYFSAGGSTVFRHDITHGMREEFKECDCVYVEPAWQRGYMTFQERVGRVGAAPSHKQYLASIRRVIEELGKPAYLVGGKHMLSTLQPTHCVETKLHNLPALLMLWNAPAMPPAPLSVMQKTVAQRHRKVLDFCCGYGQHLTQFTAFVACDINGKCVYHIAHNYLGLQ